MSDWKNWLADLETDTEVCHQPENADKIITIVNDALAAGQTVRAVGSGHSHSNAARPFAGSVLIDLSRLNNELELSSALRTDVDRSTLVRMQAGTTIRKANRFILAPRNLAFENQGSFDGQTLAGAVNTNTHGSGIETGGFADMVRSVQMVCVDKNGKDYFARLYTIEPSNGITDQVRFREIDSGEGLIQDDDTFYSVVAGYGLFGIAYSYTMRVRPLYWLTETQTRSNWWEVREQLLDTDGRGIPRVVHENHQVKYYIHTARAIKSGSLVGATTCRTDLWNELKETTATGELEDYVPLKPRRWEETASSQAEKIWPPMRRTNNTHRPQENPRFNINRVTADPLVIACIDDNFFKNWTTTMTKDLFLRSDEFTGTGIANASVCYRTIRRIPDTELDYDPDAADPEIDNTSFPGPPKTSQYATSIEIAVPIGDVVTATERLVGYLPRLGVNFLAPIGIRFTQQSRHYLSPSYRINTAWIEISGFIRPSFVEREDRSSRRFEHLTIYRRAFDDIINYLRNGDDDWPGLPQVRFHLGKHNNENRRSLEANYSRFETFVDIYKRFNESGIFKCPLSDAWEI